jgi:hypothetical protein
MPLGALARGNEDLCKVAAVAVVAAAVAKAEVEPASTVRKLTRCLTETVIAMKSGKFRTGIAAEGEITAQPTTGERPVTTTNDTEQ